MMLRLCFLIFLVKTHAFFDVDEISSIDYGMDIIDKPVKAGQVPEDDLGSRVLLTSKHGQSYQCSYVDHSHEIIQREKEEEKVAMETGIAELLKPMEDGPCLTTGKGWWTYEFCYGKEIKQFHIEDGAVTGDIISLGLFQSDFDWSNITKPQSKKAWVPRYHTQEYVNGTDCELTGSKRKSHVKFFCELSQGDYISRVDETETCVYTISVQTPRICHHPYLKPPAKSKVVPITCQPLLTDEEYAEYEAMKALEEEETQKLMRQKVVEVDSTESSRSIRDKLEAVWVSEDEGKDLDMDDGAALDSAAEQLQEIIKQSLISGLRDAFGDTQDIKVSNLKTSKIQSAELNKMIDQMLKKAARNDGKDDDEDDDLDQADDASTEVESDLKETQKDVNYDVDDDDDDALLEEFDKGLDEMSLEQLKEVNKYRDTIQQEMNSQFAQIIKEAEEELRAAGYQDSIEEEATLNALSDMLERLLKQVEAKQVTGNSKRISGMIEKAAELTRAKAGLSPKADETKSKETDSQTEDQEINITVEQGEIDAENEDVMTMEYELEYGDQGTKPVTTKLTPPSKNTKSAEDKILEKTEQIKVHKPGKSYVKNFNYHEEWKPSEDEESDNDLKHSEDETFVSETQYFSDSSGNVRIKVTSVHKDEPKDTHSSKKQADGSLTSQDGGKSPNSERVKSILTSSLKKAGLNIPEQKIQVKIFTTDDYYNEGDGAKELMETGGMINKMLVAVLGGNHEEIQEAEKQDRMENSYNFVWGKEKKKSQKAVDEM